MSVHTEWLHFRRTCLSEPERSRDDIARAKDLYFAGCCGMWRQLTELMPQPGQPLSGQQARRVNAIAKEMARFQDAVLLRAKAEDEKAGGKT